MRFLGVIKAQSMATCCGAKARWVALDLCSAGADGSDHFSMCYAPALVGGGFGPSGGHLQCEPGTLPAVSQGL